MNIDLINYNKPRVIISGNNNDIKLEKIIINFFLLNESVKLLSYIELLKLLKGSRLFFLHLILRKILPIRKSRLYFYRSIFWEYDMWLWRLKSFTKNKYKQRNLFLFIFYLENKNIMPSFNSINYNVNKLYTNWLKSNFSNLFFMLGGF